MAESEIPEDIMEVAFHLTAGDWNQPHDVRAKKVAAAILAERNAQKARDAQIAAKFYNLTHGQQARVASANISLAISRQDNPNET